MKLKQKLMATLLTVTMLMGHISILGSAVVAASTSLADQTSATNNANVQFNSYFEGGSYSKTFETTEDAKLYLSIQVSNAGYLKNGVVQFSDANFEVDYNNISSSSVQSSSTTEIKLSQINNSSSETVIEVPITMPEGETVASNLFDKITTVTFTGTYVNENGKEIAIEKEISNEVKWLGTAEIKLAGDVTALIPYETDEEQGVLVQVQVESGIEDNTLPIATTNLTLTTPSLSITNSEGNTETVSPSRVTVMANTTDGTNGKTSNDFTEDNYTYNSQTGTVEIEVTNEEQDGTISWKKNVSDGYVVTYIYTGEDVYTSITDQLEVAAKTAETLAEGETNSDAITVEVTVTANIQAYNSQETTLEKTGKITASIAEQLGELIDVEIESTSSVSKGYIYANYAKAEKQAAGETTEAQKDTDYEVTYTAKVYDTTIVNQVELETIAETYMDSSENTYTSSGTIYTKEVKISQSVFSKMLGEDGNVQITSTSGEVLGTITSETSQDSSGNYTLNIEASKVNSIIITTSKPITQGEIVVTVEKAISADQSYTKSEMESFTQLSTSVYETSIPNHTYSTDMQLTEPVSKAEISINTETLSTVVENEDVELRVVLDTSSYENALYKNPVLKIYLPQNVETVEVTSTNILLDDELTIKSTKVTEEDGLKVIQITLEGTQTTYLDNGTTTTTADQNIVATGANIVVKANITFDNLAPSASDSIMLYYTNENSNLYETTLQTKARSAEATGVASTSVEVVSPNGVVTESHMSDTDETFTISNTSTETQVESINANTASKDVTIGGIIVNNYANSVDNLYVLGRTPFGGNKEIDGTTDLGSTFTMEMTSTITVSDIDSSYVTVYYSTNEEATTDLDEADNGWAKEPEDLSAIKSYLIVLSTELASGEQFSFEYSAQVPANLDYSNSTYTTYKVYYDNLAEDATIGETKVAGLIGLTTGDAPDLSIELTSTADTVREGQIVKMIATVTNTGSTTIENIEVTIPLPENTTFMDYAQGCGFYSISDTEEVFTIESLAGGESEQIYYYIKFEDSIAEIVEGEVETTFDMSSIVVDTGDEELTDEELEQILEEIKNNLAAESIAQKEISYQAYVTADGIDETIYSKEYTLTILGGEISVELYSEWADNQVLQSGNTIEATIIITNISGSGDLTNAVVTVPLPEGTTYKEGQVKESAVDETGTIDGITYDEATNTVTISLGTLETSKAIVLNIEVEEFEGDLTLMATAQADDTEVHYSNIMEYTSEILDLQISELTSTPRYVTEGENVTYTLTLTNNGNATITAINIVDTLPEGLTFVKATYNYAGAEQSVTNLKDGNVDITISRLTVGESITITLTATAEVLADQNDKQVKNSMTVSATNIESTTTNEVTNIIEYSQELHDLIESGGATTGGSTTEARYKVTGTAWLDANKDGKRDSDEELLSGIKVLLIYKSNSTLVSDVDTGEGKIAYTDSNGQYEFSNLVSGEYLVVFVYDAGQYNVTEYQADSVDSSYNSDAISMKVILDGEQCYTGVTDTIKITSENARDIDIGLYVAEKFDLRLDKYITKVTVTTPSTGTKVYNYNNSQLLKQEVYSKDVNSSTMVIEYKIVVTNEGQVAGYVKKIIDYLPEDVKFSSELNQDWYISDSNGTVYNTALANEKIEPGESKEVTLVLSLSITDKNIGTIVNNNAEIYETYNDQGLQDYDSQEANMLDSEDDMSNADIMISLATGKIILYTSLSLAVVALLGFGIFEIKKRVLNKKNN